MTPPTRRGFCAGSLAALAAPTPSAEPLHDVACLQNFDELWRTLAERHCYFGDKATDWDRVRALPAAGRGGHVGRAVRLRARAGAGRAVRRAHAPGRPSRGQPRTLTVAGRGDVVLPLGAGQDEPALTWRRLEGDLGLIRIAGFGDEATVAAFDAALAALADTRGLLVDVRANGGGDTAVARPIMGRFTATPKPYARMRRREGAGLGPFWTEMVEPRGPFTYRRPVVVLCDRWSASMAEGFPMGVRAVCGARIVGRPTMGLGAAVYRLRLDRTGVEAQYSAEPVCDVEGRPRSDLRPDVPAPDGADVLAAGVRELHRLAG